MSNPHMHITFIFEVSRSKPMLEPNENLNEVLVKTGKEGINCRAPSTITSLLVLRLH